MTNTAELQEGSRTMHNQHAGLSQVLAEQRMTQHHEQAAYARLAGGGFGRARRGAILS